MKTNLFVPMILLIVSLASSACGTGAVPATETSTLAPAPTSRASETPTPTIPPMETPAFAPTQALTPTAGPPPTPGSLYFKKSKCLVHLPTRFDPRYIVQVKFLLQWPDLPNEDGYWLYRDGDRVAELPANTTVYADLFTPVKPNRTSTYYLVAYNALGQSRGPQTSAPNPC